MASSDVFETVNSENETWLKLHGRDRDFAIKCMLNAWKIPQECMQTVTVPTSENKNGDTDDAGNYRPVSLATIVSKLFEHYILSCISPLLATTDNQLGFKPKHGTGMCIFYFNRLCLIM